MNDFKSINEGLIMHSITDSTVWRGRCAGQPMIGAAGRWFRNERCWNCEQSGTGRATIRQRLPQVLRAALRWMGSVRRDMPAKPVPKRVESALGK